MGTVKETTTRIYTAEAGKKIRIGEEESGYGYVNSIVLLPNQQPEDFTEVAIEDIPQEEELIMNNEELHLPQPLQNSPHPIPPPRGGS